MPEYQNITEDHMDLLHVIEETVLRHKDKLQQILAKYWQGQLYY